MNNSKI